MLSQEKNRSIKVREGERENEGNKRIDIEVDTFRRVEIGFFSLLERFFFSYFCFFFGQNTTLG